jgi:hypothetical protein
MKNLVTVLATCVAASLSNSPHLYAQDARGDEIFGGSAPEASTPQPAPPSSPASSVSSFAETLQIGGRLEWRSQSAQGEQQKFQESSYSQLKRADIYFDSRPNPDLRSFMRLRFSEEVPANTPQGNQSGSCTTCTKTEMSELWFKWDQADSVFYTLGKQNLKWGSGRLWNPTDFTAQSARDPLALFDSRLGQELFKIHIPVESSGFNYYGIVQFDNMRRNDDIGGALRGEFAFGGYGEAAVSFQTRQDSPIQFGLDVSSGLGPIDVYVEAAVSKRQGRTFYEGRVDPVNRTLPTEKDREKETFRQVVGGVQYTYKYSSEDNLTVGGEYFDNGLGYDDRTLELYALVKQQATPLYAGRRYAGAYLRLASPGSWNDTSFFINSLRNMSDATSVSRVTATWTLYNDLTIEGFLSQCSGDYGELCFRIPEDFKALSANPTLTDSERQTLAALPTKRTRSNAGFAFSLQF